MPPFANAFYSARIMERRDLSDNPWIIRVDPGGDFRFLPGQYATLGVDSPEGRRERPYSIVSAPHEKLLEFFLELLPHGDLTPGLYSCRVGDELSLRKTAKGRFTLDTSGVRANHLLLATVTGVAPFVSYVRSLFHQWKSAKYDGAHRPFLIEGASRSWELGYGEEMANVAGEAPWLTYIPTISRPWEDKTWTGETGRIDDLIRKYTDSWGLTPENTTVYLCGHPDMIENTSGIVRRRGWHEDALKREAYFVAGNETVASEN